MRAILGTVLALVLLTVALAGVCVACQPGSAPMKGDCCKGHGKCPRPAGKTPSQCGTPSADSFTVEKAASLEAPVVSVQAAVEPFAPVESPRPVADVSAYSPPDLRILNSSLTI